MDRATVIRRLEEEQWYRGSLRHTLRQNSQRVVYDEIMAWKAKHPGQVGPIVLNAHRAFGKSYLLLAMGIERCISRPNQDVKFAAPTGKQCTDIATPLLRLILKGCPKDLQPHKAVGKYLFKNPRWEDKDAVSVLHIVSCKDDAERQRGLRSDMVVIDECRDVPNFRYVTNDIFLFHFAGRPDPLLILSSTPPNSMDHPWVGMIDEACLEDEGRYIEFPVTSNKDWTPKDDSMLLAVCGSKESTTWQREALCMRRSEESHLIVPEFQHAEETTVLKSRERPGYFFPHTCVDFGFMDHTAVLFGYVDFREQTLVIEDEIFVKYKTTGEIVALIREKEKALGYEGYKYPIRRIGDNDPQQLANLTRDHDLPISAADKWDKERWLSDLRYNVQSGKIRILECCKSLIYQLRNGVRKPDEDRLKFIRGEKVGHCDCIDALIYLNRMINWRANPYPYVDDFDPRNQVRLGPPPQGTGSIRITERPLVIFEGQML